MPVSKYYEGHGTKVMASMKKQYGSEKGERVFYATANKKHQKSDSAPMRGLKKAARG